jgi:hypothetical protein
LTLPVLIILAVLWAVVLLPPLLRSRSQRSADSIVDFNYKLDMLGQTNGNRRSFRRRAALPDPGVAPVVAPPGLVAEGYVPPAYAPPGYAAVPGLHVDPAIRSAKRRRDVLRVLGFAFLGTLLIAVLTGSSAAWGLQIFVDVVGAAYLALWAWVRNVQAERLDKVRYMPELRTPELVLRRSASS